MSGDKGLKRGKVRATGVFLLVFVDVVHKTGRPFPNRSVPNFQLNLSRFYCFPVVYDQLCLSIFVFHYIFVSYVISASSLVRREETQVLETRETVE